MKYNEKFVYYSNSPGFYAIYFLRKKLFWCYMVYNWDVKIPGKEKKNYYCKEHKFSLMFTALSVLFIRATTTTSPLVTLLPSTPHSSVDHGQHAGHRPELYASLYALPLAKLLFHCPLLHARPMRRVKK